MYSGAYMQQSLNTRIDETNVGHKLLKKMGELLVDYIIVRYVSYMFVYEILQCAFYVQITISSQKHY